MDTRNICSFTFLCSPSSTVFTVVITERKCPEYRTRCKGLFYTAQNTVQGATWIEILANESSWQEEKLFASLGRFKGLWSTVILSVYISFHWKMVTNDAISVHCDHFHHLYFKDFKRFHYSHINRLHQMHISGSAPVSAVPCCTKLLQLCLTLCDPMDHSLPGSSIHGIFQARIPEWGAISSSTSFQHLFSIFHGHNQDKSLSLPSALE